MSRTGQDAATLVERFGCPSCQAPAGSPCRTRSGSTALGYHTPRFVLVPSLGGAAEVAVPADRGPGRGWVPGPALEVRIGYAYAGSADDLAAQVAALDATGCARVYRDVVGVAVKARPGLDEALRCTADQGRIAPDGRVRVVVTELWRLARTSVELVRLAAAWPTCPRLEVRDGPMAGIHGPGGPLFSVLAAAAGLDREYHRFASREGQQGAAGRGRAAGRPRVFDDDLLRAARALRDAGVPVPQIAARLTIATGRNAGGHPSVASVYRALSQPIDDPTDDTAGRQPQWDGPTRPRVR